MAANSLRVKTVGSILHVAIDRPPANAIDAATSREMGTLFARFRDDAHLRVAILTGSGAKFFCAGWDLKAAAAGEAPDADFGIGGFGGIRDLPDLNKPVIAAVNGIAVGGGLELALSADLIVAADHSRFCLPGVNVGAITEWAATTLPHRIPYHLAMEMLLTGRWLDVQEAFRFGFVNSVVAAEDLEKTAWELAKRIASGAPLVQAAMKDIAHRVDGEMYAETMARMASKRIPAVETLYASDDLQEGARAFVEKRKPVWTGQ